MQTCGSNCPAASICFRGPSCFPSSSKQAALTVAFSGLQSPTNCCEAFCNVMSHKSCSSALSLRQWTLVMAKAERMAPHDPAEVGEGGVRLADPICGCKHTQQPLPLTLNRQLLGPTLLKPQGCHQGDVVHLRLLEIHFNTLDSHLILHQKRKNHTQKLQERVLKQGMYSRL